MMLVKFRAAQAIILIEGQRKEVMSMDSRKLPSMITIKQATQETGLPEYLLRKLCITKQVKSIKSGKKYYLNSDSLNDYLTEKGVQT